MFKSFMHYRIIILNCRAEDDSVSTGLCVLVRSIIRTDVRSARQQGAAGSPMAATVYALVYTE